MKSAHEKIFFAEIVDEGEIEVETIWCIKDGDNYIVDSIPVTAKGVSLADVIKVCYNEEKKTHCFKEIVNPSGNSTIRIYFDEKTCDVAATRKTLRELGCKAELIPSKKIISINIPGNTNYNRVKEFLQAGEKHSKWIFEESCFRHSAV